MSTMGATVLALGYLLPLFYLMASLINGEKCGPNPWGAKGLEWEAADSPPLPENFEATPIVTEEAYAYAQEEGAVVH
jgi:cytochrome c oxidase subunit 1